MFGGRCDAAGGLRRWLFLPQSRMGRVDLPHLRLGTPPAIAMTRLAQVEDREVFEPASRMEAGGRLVGQCLVVDKAVGRG